MIASWEPSREGDGIPLLILAVLNGALGSDNKTCVRRDASFKTSDKQNDTTKTKTYHQLNSLVVGIGASSHQSTISMVVAKLHPFEPKRPTQEPVNRGIMYFKGVTLSSYSPK
eukprot:5510771-Amphidinium_carterae.1